MVSDLSDKGTERTRIECIHCKNVQYVSEALKELSSRLYCYSCQNEIKLEDYKYD